MTIGRFMSLAVAGVFFASAPTIPLLARVGDTPQPQR